MSQYDEEDAEEEHSQSSYDHPAQHFYEFGPHESPRVTEVECDHLGHSHASITEYANGDAEFQCDSQDNCDLFKMNRCPLMHWTQDQIESESQDWD